METPKKSTKRFETIVQARAYREKGLASYHQGYLDGQTKGYVEGDARALNIAWQKGNKDEDLRDGLMFGSIKALHFQYVEDDNWKEDYEDDGIPDENCWLNILQGFLAGYLDGFKEGYESGYEREQRCMKRKEST